MTGRLRVDTDLLVRTGTALRAIATDLDDVATTSLRAVLGHDGLGDAVDAFARGWEDARAATVRTVTELGEACREVAATFEDVDDGLATRLREAFT